MSRGSLSNSRSNEFRPSNHSGIQMAPNHSHDEKSSIIDSLKLDLSNLKAQMDTVHINLNKKRSASKDRTTTANRTPDNLSANQGFADFPYNNFKRNKAPPSGIHKIAAGSSSNYSKSPHHNHILLDAEHKNPFT